MDKELSAECRICRRAGVKGGLCYAFSADCQGWRRHRV